MRSLRLVLCSSLLAAVLGAQGVVLPTHFRISEGNGFSSEGIGANTPVRHLQIHDAAPARTIRSIAFRRDGGSYNSATIPPGVAVCDLWVSTSSTNAGQPNTSYDQNHGNDKAQVLTATPVQFPGTVPGPLARPFLFKFPFGNPFVFGAQGSLCWDLRITTRSNVVQMHMDSCHNWDANPGAIIWPFGTGCRASGQTQPLTLQGTSTPDWPNLMLTIGYQGSQMPASRTVFLAIGVSAETWGTLPLPFTLPGTGSSPSGPCSITNDQLLLVPATTSAAGAFASSFPIPVNVAHNGVGLFAQVVALDAPANNWGVVLSNSVQHHLLTPYSTVPLAEVYGPATSSTGTSRSYQGSIVMVD